MRKIKRAGTASFQSNCSMASDSTTSSMVIMSGFKLAIAPQSFVGTPLEWLNITNYFKGKFSGESLNGNLYEDRASPGFQDMFAWLKMATYAGPRPSSGGTTLQAWALDLRSPVNVSLLLLADGNTPVVLSENLTYFGVPMHIDYAFSSFTPGGELPHAWDGFNESAFSHTPPCPAAAGALSPRNQTVYIFHPRHQFNISQQDNGDLDGDVFFVCEQALSSIGGGGQPGEDYQWITQWTLELIPRWGQYQNCNGYPEPLCLGAERFWVGHEAALGLGPPPSAGQCHANPLTGEWFSLPEPGRCAHGATPDGKTCTWREAHVKTIDAKCLFAHGYVDACKATGRAPFTAARKVFAEAFASEDPSRGGCPALPGPRRRELE